MIHSSARWLCVLVLLLSGAATEAREMQFCVLKDEAWSVAEHMARMQQVGVQCAKVFYALNDMENKANPYAWVTRYLDEGYEVILVLRINEAAEKNVLGETLTGSYDVALRGLTDAIRKDGRPITVILWHEADGDWYEHGMYAKGNIPELLARAFVYVADRFRDVPNVTIEANFNRRDAFTKKPLSEALRYLATIDTVVDSFSFSSYDRCLSSDAYTQERSFAEEFGPAYRALHTHKPVNIAETSTTGFCGNKLRWFKAMLEAIDTEFTRVETITFALGVVPIGKASNTVPIPWGFDTAEERAAFAALLNEYRRKWGVPEVLAAPEAGAETNRSLVAGLLRGMNFTSAPWSFSGSVRYPFMETFNPAVNSVTGNPYGETGALLNLQFKQRFLWDGDWGLTYGPGFYGWLWDSENNEQYWFNNYGAGLSFGVYGDLSNSSKRLGTWGLEAYIEQWLFTTDTIPNRFQENGDTRGGVRLQFNTDGNLLK